MGILDEINQPFRGNGPAYRKPSEEDLAEHDRSVSSMSVFFQPPEVQREEPPPPPPPFEPKLPTLSDDVKANFAELIAAIEANGLPFDREALASNGRRLLAKQRAFGRESRYFLGPGNLSDWKTVKELLFQWHCVTNESGPINSFAECWRVTQHQARQVHRHWLAEEALKLGVKLLESLGSSGRLQSELFTTSLRGLDVEFGHFETRLFLAEWQNCVQTLNGKELVTIDLKRSVASLIAWMADDRQLADFLRDPDPLGQLAVAWSPELRRIEAVKNSDRTEAGAVLSGVLFAHAQSSLRSFCGDHFGLNLSIEDLSARRGDLFTRFRKMRAFLEEFKGQVGTEFWRRTSNMGHYEFLEARYFERVADSIRHRRFLANAVMARAAFQALAGDGKIIAAWRDQITLEVQSKYTVRIAQEVAQAIRAALEAAFPGLVVILEARFGVSLANTRPLGVPTGETVGIPSRYFIVKQMIGGQYHAGDIIERSAFDEAMLEHLLRSGAIIEADAEPETPERKFPAFFPPAEEKENQP